MVQAAQFSSIETSTVIPMSDRALQSICESISRIAQKQGGTVWTEIPGLASSRLLLFSFPLDKSSPQQKQSSPLLQRAISHVARHAISSTQSICFPRNPGERWRGHQTLPIFFWEVTHARLEQYKSVDPISQLGCWCI